MLMVLLELGNTVLLLRLIRQTARENTVSSELVGSAGYSNFQDEGDMKNNYAWRNRPCCLCTLGFSQCLLSEGLLCTVQRGIRHYHPSPFSVTRYFSPSHTALVGAAESKASTICLINHLWSLYEKIPEFTPGKMSKLDDWPPSPLCF